MISLEEVELHAGMEIDWGGWWVITPAVVSCVWGSREQRSPVSPGLPAWKKVHIVGIS